MVRRDEVTGGRRVWARLGALTTMLGAMVAAAGTAGEARAEEAGVAARRQAMMEEIDRAVRTLAPYTGRKALAPRVRAAMATTPRHEFVPSQYREHAYLDRPLPIGLGQTISQPSMVAVMTDLLDLEEDDALLEVGTGSGYQAAVAAKLVRKLYTIEIVEPLAARAKETLARLGIDNVETRTGDGYAGWPEKAPFDAIIVTAACDEVPAPLLEQLAPGGRMVLPIGPVRQVQQLTLITKSAGGEIARRILLPVAFVPLTGEHGG